MLYCVTPVTMYVTFVMLWFILLIKQENIQKQINGTMLKSPLLDIGNYFLFTFPSKKFTEFAVFT